MTSMSSAPYLLSIPNKGKPNSQSNQPDPAISLLQNCKSPKEAKQLHTLLIKTSLIKEKHAFGRLLFSFASFNSLGTLPYAQKLFDTVDIPRNSFMYTTMIRSYANHGDPRKAFVLYSKMLCEDVYPDDYTFTYVFSACSKFSAVFEGKQAHAQMIKCPFKFGVHSWNSLMDFYGKIGEVGIVVRRIFDRIESPDIVSWNCLINGYVKSGDLDEAQQIFDEIPVRDVVSWTILLVGYANAGLLSEATCLFNEMPKRNLVSWSALIGGYIQIGCYSKALELFKEMQVAKVKMDEVIVTTLLSACARLGALDQGRWLHMFVDKHGIKIDAHLATALIDMYSKCGEISMARKVFQGTTDKKVFVWSSMIGGLAMHSFGEEAIQLFTMMLDCGVKPSEVTYINILAACTHSGLVDVGLKIFNKMAEDQKLQPRMEHYGCLVDLLGRAGLLYDAFHIVKTMPMKVDPAIWRALLSACKLHRNVELGEQVGRILIEIEPKNDMNYVLLSNIYAAVNRWETSGKLRRDMKVKGLQKTPGCSSIELHGVVHEFVSRDHSHPQSQAIYELLHIAANHILQDGGELMMTIMTENQDT